MRQRGAGRSRSSAGLRNLVALVVLIARMAMVGARACRESQSVPIGVHDVEGAEPGHDAGQLAHARVAVVEATADRVLGIDLAHGLVIVPLVDDRHMFVAGNADIVLNARVNPSP
jgi:hypothetical protein